MCSFLNPVRAKLVRSIDNYKGPNTWKEFLSSKADLNTVIEKEIPWVLAPDLEPLSQRNPSWSEERRVLEDMRCNLGSTRVAGLSYDEYCRNGEETLGIFKRRTLI